MKSEIPGSLKIAATAFVDELSKHPLMVRLRLLTAMIASELAQKESPVQDLLATHVIVGLLSVLHRTHLVKTIAKKNVEDLLSSLSSPANFKKFLN